MVEAHLGVKQLGVKIWGCCYGHSPEKAEFEWKVLGVVGPPDGTFGTSSRTKYVIFFCDTSGGTF